MRKQETQRELVKHCIWSAVFLLSALISFTWGIIFAQDGIMYATDVFIGRLEGFSLILVGILSSVSFFWHLNDIRS